MRHAHSDRVERLLGTEAQRISEAMREFYWPIKIAVPGGFGTLTAMPGGDFKGSLAGGRFMGLLEYQWDRYRQFVKVFARKQRGTLNAGLASMDEIISESTQGGKRRTFSFLKVGTTGVLGASNSLWRVGAQPAAGAAAAAAPGGTVPTDATTGAFPFANPASGDTQHFTTGWPIATVASQTLLLYDRIFAVAKTMSSVATEAVTGVPTRYQSSTAGNDDYSGGNFMFPEIGSALGATAHNWNTCQYTDQDGNTLVNLPSVAGNASGIINRLDLPVGYFYMPLAANDTGVKALTQMQCSASVTGAVDFVIGHPIVMMPLYIASQVALADSINTSFGLERIFDDACLAMLELVKGATTATTFTGQFQTVAS